MAKSRRKFTRPVLGDIVEIPVKNGFGYAQYINRHKVSPMYGDLIRVFKGVFDSRPADFSRFVRTREQFQTFYPVGSAVRQRLVTIVAHEVVPERCRQLPMFKAYNQNYHTGKRTWFLWDGKRDQRIERLTAQQRRYPLLEIISHPILVERIEEGWTSADERE